MSSINSLISFITLSSLLGSGQSQLNQSPTSNSINFLSQLFAPQGSNGGNNITSILPLLMAFGQLGEGSSTGLPDLSSLFRTNTANLNTVAATTTGATTITTAGATAITTAGATNIAKGTAINNGTLTLTGQAGIMPDGFNSNNLPDTIIYNGVTYAKSHRGGSKWAYKATTIQPKGSNYLNLGLRKRASTDSASSSPTMSGSPYSGSSEVWEYNIKTSSPLVLDIDGNGSTDAIAERHQFDINADGQLDSINKINAKDGLLAFDADQDGKVGEDGKELFGNYTLGEEFENGFEALKAVAKKVLGQAAVSDNKLDAAEIKQLEAKIKLSLKLGDTVRSLSSLNISELSLKYGDNYGHLDQFGNLIGEDGQFTINGKQQKVIDIYFNHH